MVQIQVRNRYLTWDGVAGATVSVRGTTLTGTTNRNGLVELDFSAVPDGRQVVEVRPAHSTTAEAGPATAETGATPARIYRELDVTVNVCRGRIVDAGAVCTPNGSAGLRAHPRILVELQPVWMQSPNHGARGGTTTDMIIVHHTGNASTASALNTFLNAGSTSAGYVIDPTGQVIKMVRDADAAHHAGESHWAGTRGVNRRSIGIELVHASGAYPDAQYAALVRLLERLRAAHPAIPRHGIVGHSDIGTNAAGVLGRKSGDPGATFDWTRLERRNLSLGVLMRAGPPAPGILGGLFRIAANVTLQQNDRDDVRRFGGAARTGVTGDPITTIQQQLGAIGYSVGTADGVYSQRTAAAVRMFQQHFSLRETGMVDFWTAGAILSFAAVAAGAIP